MPLEGNNFWWWALSFFFFFFISFLLYLPKVSAPDGHQMRFFTFDDFLNVKPIFHTILQNDHFDMENPLLTCSLISFRKVTSSCSPSIFGISHLMTSLSNSSTFPAFPFLTLESLLLSHLILATNVELSIFSTMMCAVSSSVDYEYLGAVRHGCCTDKHLNSFNGMLFMAADLHFKSMMGTMIQCG